MVKAQLKFITGVIFMVTMIVATFLYIETYRTPSISPKNKDYTYINGGTFDQNIAVFITNDTALVREYSVTMDFNSSACTVDEDGLIMMWFPSIPDNSLIAHELTHVNQFLLQDAGVTYSENTDEVYAYEMAYLTKEFLKKIKHD